MDSKEVNAIIQNQKINKNAVFEIETSLNASTSTKSSSKINEHPNTKFCKKLNISPIVKSENKRKVNSQVTVSPPQKKFEVLNSSAKKAIAVRSPTKSNCFPLHFKSSQLQISGQKIVDESVSENRAMKCCNYDIPDIISPIVSNSHKSYMQSNITATSSLMRRQQLREQHMKKIRMMQQNMMVNCKNPDKLVTHEDLIQIKKGIDYLERKQKITEETKKKDRNHEIQNSNFVNLLPTVIL